MNNVSCIECAAEINLAENTEVGEIIVCPDCGSTWRWSHSNPRPSNRLRWSKRIGASS